VAVQQVAARRTGAWLDVPRGPHYGWQVIDSKLLRLARQQRYRVGLLRRGLADGRERYRLHDLHTGEPLGDEAGMIEDELIRVLEGDKEERRLRGMPDSPK
jgi:hypothetical protein